MTFCVRSRPAAALRAALAAAMTLALAACAGIGIGGGRVDTKPDRPFKTTDVCLDSGMPDGWIRTNDWRGKGCGVEDGDAQAKKTASAHDRDDGIQLASTAVLPSVKTKAKTKDVSRGVNAVSERGPNNWMTITELDRVRVGRSLTACAGAVPEGWIEKARYWDKGRCGNPAKKSDKNVMLIERVK